MEIDKKTDADNEQTVRLVTQRKRHKKRFAIILTAVLFVIIVCGIYLFTIPTLSSASGNLARAAKAMDNNEYDYAIALVSKKLTVHKDDSDLYVKRSAIFLKRATDSDEKLQKERKYSEVDRNNDFESAYRDASKAVELDSTSISAKTQEQRVNMYQWYWNRKKPYSETEVCKKQKVEEIPDKTQLDQLLIRLYCASKDKNGNLGNAFDSANLDEKNVYQAVISDSMHLSELYPSMKYQKVSAESKEVRELKRKNESYTKVSKEDANWICSNIFNMSESFQRDYQSESEKEGLLYSDDKYFYCGSNPVDATNWSVRYESIIYDGEKYYIRYSMNNLEETGSHGYYFLTAAQKEISGKKYWSIYSNENKSPEGPQFPAAKKLKKASKTKLPYSLSLLFSSGAGGWGTQMKLNDDGSFTGKYSLHNATENTDLEFEGRFSNIKKVSDVEYSMELSYLSTDDVNGISGGRNFRLYLPGRSTADFSDELKMWLMYAPGIGNDNGGVKSTLGSNVLYNCDKEYGFYEYE